MMMMMIMIMIMIKRDGEEEKGRGVRVDDVRNRKWTWAGGVMTKGRQLRLFVDGRWW
jgi:hypothetical protein